MVVLEIRDDAGFASALQSAKGKLVVVDFFATWCGPCKVVAPIFDGLSTKYTQECVFLKVDVDQVREVAQAAGVKQLPSFGFYHQGKLLELIVGGDPRSIENKIKTLSEKYATFAFKGPGNSLLGGSSSAASAAPASKPAAAAAAPARRNPWADPDFKLAKAAAAKPAATPAAAPAAAPKPAATATAPKPATAATATTAAAPSSSSGDRVNPWATKEVPKAAAAAAPPAAAPKPTPAAASAPAVAPTPAAPVAAAAAAAPASDSSASAPAPAADSAPADPATSSSSAEPAPATATGASSASAPAAGPAGNDPSLTKQLNPTFLSALLEMGFGQVRAEKALILTGNKGIDQGLNWIMQHENDADIDEPLQVVGTAAKAPAGVNLDDMDEDERMIYESLQKKKLTSSGVAFSGGANVAPEKVSTLNMTTEEKMAWLAQRRAEVRQRKEVEALETMKEKEKNRKNTVKSVQALDELKEQMQRKAADDAIKAKKKEAEEKKKARANILAKLEEDKARRREQAKREMDAIQAQKAAAAAAAAKK